MLKDVAALDIFLTLNLTKNSHFKMKNKKIMKPKGKEREDAYKGEFTVIKFIMERPYGKFFECIPDVWFVDESKLICFWPPKSGKSFSLRALTGENQMIRGMYTNVKLSVKVTVSFYIFRVECVVNNLK